MRGATFNISTADDGTIRLSGRLDAAQEEKAREVLDAASGPTVIDFSELSYISSAGLGVLLRAQKRLMEGGNGLKIVNLSPPIREIFEMAGFDRIFDLE
ncbi:MAG: STAS domain-containing protein [Acidobacteriota bacterium]|nr:STAS domain-containing protein [Acidobacteriota bacterium]